MKLKNLKIEPKEMVGCICPRCGQIFEKYVEHGHIYNPFAWRIAGYLVVVCQECK